jgi:hypothetical protein
VIHQREVRVRNDARTDRVTRGEREVDQGAGKVVDIRQAVANEEHADAIEGHRLNELIGWQAAERAGRDNQRDDGAANHVCAPGR